MAEPRRRGINNRMVEALTARRESIVWDRRLAGFGVRAYPSGARVYVAQARGPDGIRRVALGRHGVLNAEQARRLAARTITRILAGQYPAPGRSSARRSGPTVAEVARRYLNEHLKLRCKPSTVRTRGLVIDNHIVPALGARPLAAVRREEVLELHQRLARTPVQANMVMVTLSQIFRKAQLWGIVPPGTNPCARVALYRQRKRERFLTAAELARLGRALDGAAAQGGASPAAVAAIRLLALTGCRKGEILPLRWENVELEAAELRLRDSKTGPRVVPLSTAALDVLRELRRSARSGWVIPGRKRGTHLQKLGNAWRRLRKRAELEDVRLHDLRHSFASRALALGENLPMIAKLLGHRRVESTVRYAHLARGAVREAAERVAASLAEDIL